MDVVTRSSTPATGAEHHGHDEGPSGPTTTRRASSRPPWLAPAVVGAAAIGACAFVYALNPVEEGNPPICPFKMMTGQDCPGCGATRSLNALLRGQPGVAADHNLLFVVALPVVVVAFVVWGLRRMQWRAPDWHLPRHWLPAFAVVVALFRALRLLPWDPFAWLASGT